MEFYFDMDENLDFGFGTDTNSVYGYGIQKIRTLTEAEYKTISHDDKTFYLVQTEAGIMLYLGDAAICSDGSSIDEARLARLETTVSSHAQQIQDLDTTAVRSSTTRNIVAMTQAEYDALEHPDEDTLYILT